MKGYLPTPWLRDVPSARARLDERGKLELRLPTALVPVRRYATVRVGRGAYGAIQIDVSHQERFLRPSPDRNAWQSSGSPEYKPSRLHPDRMVRVNSRVLARKREDLVGDLHAIASLFIRLAAAPEGLDLLVRVTPEGFQFLVDFDHGGCQLAGVGERLRRANDPIDLVRAHPFHGDGYDPRSAPPPPPHNLAPNCRCITQKKEDEDMSDLTTSDTLPFGLIAGEAIVRCEFSDNSGKDYAYFAGGLALAEGDYVVVASPYGDGGAVYDEESGGYLKVVRVVSTDANAESIKKAAKWIISKVDVADYRQRRAMVEQLKLIDEQIKVAEREARKLLELSKLRDLSPELAALIDARTALTGGAKAS